MVEQWAGELIGKMHQYGVTGKRLAAHVAWNPKYLSAVLNGRRQPKKAQAVLETALDELVLNIRGTN